ncbi:MAG: hypothetical protein C5B51_19815 [Terriglobia bacterium]|nr:MAG: hypothetical protein C5B51_19815 [Terriglobia bacterium]
MRHSVWLIPALCTASLAAAYGDYLSIQDKFHRIESDRLRPGSRIELTAKELNAYVDHEVGSGADGVRNPKLELPAPGVARASALVDFAKIRRSQGHPPGWLMSKLLEGERPVSVTARIRSGQGQATVDVQRVEISGIEIDGRTLDFLIQYVLLPAYPNAVVGRSFELAHHIEKLDIQPAAVGVIIGR